MSIAYKTLDNIDISLIYEAFTAAFSDYVIKLEMNQLQLRKMLARRRYKPEISIGAFERNQLVGFILNGIRSVQGVLTAYDTGTGVIPEYRNQGISTRMLQNALIAIRQQNALLYSLEVITTNESAFRLYQKKGFRISRRLACFKINKNSLHPKNKILIETLEEPDRHFWTDASSFWNFHPSWQNSPASVNVAPNDFICLVARHDGVISGYGVLDPKTGDAPQLAVKQGFRRMGIGSSILFEMKRKLQSEHLSFLNIDCADGSSMEFFKHFGFINHASQYEMIFEIKK
jgi:ribosomal protein S18 acetylase RimI-like enzyme